MTDFLWLVLFPLGIAAIASFIVVWLRPGWSMRRTIMVAALPLPAVATLVCLAIFTSAATAQKEKCGVDACGMAMMFSTILLGYALMAAALGAAVALLIKRVFRPR